jgi:hypothetical protein
MREKLLLISWRHTEISVFFPKNAIEFIISSCLFRIILTSFVNHVLKFKWLVKRMLYTKVDSYHLNRDVKGLRVIYIDLTLLNPNMETRMFLWPTTFKGEMSK